MTSSFEVVVVAYRSRILVEQLLAGLDDALPVAVVDNSRGEDGLADVVATRPGARYLWGPGRGFATAANLGIRSSEHPVVVLVGPDTLPGAEQLRALVDELDADPRLAACCAVTVDDAGRGELGVGGWEPGVRRALVHAVGLHLLRPTAGLWARPEPHYEIDVDWVGGSCLAIPVRHFDALGGLDEGYFVYGEDVAFGRAAREAGLHSRVVSDVVVRSQPGTSGDSSTRMLRVRGASMMRYLARHHPRPRREGVRLVLTAGIAARAVRCRLRGRHAETAEHVAYLRGLWRGAGP